MKLNYDCIRDVLLVLEVNLTMDEDLSFNVLNLDEILKYPQLSKYSDADIYYSIYNLNEIGFIDAHISFADGGIPYLCLVTNITYAGHDFLADIKSDNVWSKTKKQLSNIGSMSLSVLSEISKQIILNQFINPLT